MHDVSQTNKITHLLVKTSFSGYFYVKQQLRETRLLPGKPNGSVGIVTRLNDEDGSIPCEGKRLLPSPKHRNQLWGAPPGDMSLELTSSGCKPDR
jgi:hypothetical protein